MSQRTWRSEKRPLLEARTTVALQISDNSRAYKEDKLQIILMVLNICYMTDKNQYALPKQL